ncbi:MAG: hypothetical protein K5778_00495 [Bacteroidaceae bacterium]|nr:hypothetical protein [Bacteroidaceae bacterium]
MNVTLKPGEKWFEQFIVPSKETNDGNTPTEYHQSAPCPPIPAEFESAMAYLRHLTQEGISQRLGALPSVAATERINRELALIEQKGWQNYFLFIWDLVKSAEETLPSCFVHVAYEAPSCLVNYLLHITEVNPLDYNLPENIFMRETKKLFPYIVLQIDSANYPDFIDLMKQKYGRKIAQTASFSESHTHPYTHREYPARMGGPTFVWAIADRDLDSFMPMTECKTGTKESFSCPIYDDRLISQHGAARQNIQTAPYCIDYITQTLAELGIFFTDKKKFLNTIPLNDADTLRSIQSFNEQDVREVFGGWRPDQGLLSHFPMDTFQDFVICRALFMEGGLKNGYSHQQLEEIFDMLRNTYTSHKSHDVSCTLAYYRAAYLKLHYPTEWQRAVQSAQDKH